MKEFSNIGEFLRTYRKQHNDMTLRELATKTGISFSHLSKIERGEHTPSKPTLKILSEKLNINLDKLYILSGYTPENYVQEDIPVYTANEDPRNKIIKKIATEFPDADLMFKDLANMTAEQLEEVYEFIKFKKSQKK